MPDFNGSMTGFIVNTQKPLDGKNYFKTLESIKDLGTDNNLAFGYYACMPAFCLENKTWYVWDESDKKNVVGLIGDDFVYPEGSEVYGIDYSGKAYNFYPFSQYVSGATYTKALTGFLTQEGTNDPVLTIQSNTIGEAEDFEALRNSIGDYNIGHPFFTESNFQKIFVLIGTLTNTVNTLAFVKYSISEDGKIRITTVKGENEFADDILLNTPIKIEFFG